MFTILSTLNKISKMVKICHGTVTMCDLPRKNSMNLVRHVIYSARAVIAGSRKHRNYSSYWSGYGEF